MEKVNLEIELDSIESMPKYLKMALIGSICEQHPKRAMELWKEMDFYFWDDFDSSATLKYERGFLNKEIFGPTMTPLEAFAYSGDGKSFDSCFKSIEKKSKNHMRRLNSEVKRRIFSCVIHGFSGEELLSRIQVLTNLMGTYSTSTELGLLAIAAGKFDEGLLLASDIPFRHKHEMKIILKHRESEKDISRKYWDEQYVDCSNALSEVARKVPPRKTSIILGATILNKPWERMNLAIYNKNTDPWFAAIFSGYDTFKKRLPTLIERGWIPNLQVFAIFLETSLWDKDAVPLILDLKQKDEELFEKAFNVILTRLACNAQLESANRLIDLFQKDKKSVIFERSLLCGVTISELMFFCRGAIPNDWILPYDKERIWKLSEFPQKGVVLEVNMKSQERDEKLLDNVIPQRAYSFTEKIESDTTSFPKMIPSRLLQIVMTEAYQEMTSDDFKDLSKFGNNYPDFVAKVEKAILDIDRNESLTKRLKRKI